MLYQLLKILTKLYFNIYFKNIYIQGADLIPSDIPMVYISNHPCSFMEACLLATFQKRNLHFLVRGDMFEKKWLKPILKHTYQIPIYRFKDGFEKLRNNKSSFSESFEVLAQNQSVLLFPEGSTVYVPWIRSFQKGSARLATGAMAEKNIPEVMIQPCAVHYLDALNTRTSVYIQFGEPISTKDFVAAQAESKDILSDLTESLYQKMDQLVISYPEDIDRTICDNIISAKTNKPASVLHFWNQVSELPSRIATGIRNLRNDAPLLKTFSENKIWSSKHLDIQLDASHQTSSDKFFQILILIITAVLMIPAALVFALPFNAIKNWTSKLKSIEFRPPTRLAVTMISHILISKIIFIVLWISYNFKTAFCITVLLQVSLIAMIIFMDAWHIIRQKSIDPNLAKQLNKDLAQINF